MSFVRNLLFLLALMHINLCLAVTNRRSFCRFALSSFQNFFGAIVDTTDLRGDFSIELNRLVEASPEIPTNILRLGSMRSQIPFIWNTEVENIILNGSPTGANISLFSPHQASPDSKVEHRAIMCTKCSEETLTEVKAPRKYQMIYDVGVGSLSHLTSFPKALNSSITALEDNGTIAIQFPSPHKNSSLGISNKLTENFQMGFNPELLDIRLNNRYQLATNRKIIDNGATPKQVRLNGIYVYRKDGNFITLKEWLSINRPEIEIVEAALINHNQLILRKRAAVDIEEMTGPRFNLSYVGSTGKAESDNTTSIQFHFYKEIDLEI